MVKQVNAKLKIDKKKSGSGISVLTNPQRVEVCRMLAERMSIEEVVEVLTKQGIKISSAAIFKYKHSPRWNKLIMRMRRTFEKELTRIPIANKSYRLKLLQKIAKQGLKWHVKGYTKDGIPIYEQKIGVAANAVHEAREEMKLIQDFTDPLTDESIDSLFSTEAKRRDFQRFLN